MNHDFKISKSIFDMTFVEFCGNFGKTLWQWYLWLFYSMSTIMLFKRLLRKNIHHWIVQPSFTRFWDMESDPVFRWECDNNTWNITKQHKILWHNPNKDEKNKKSKKGEQNGKNQTELTHGVVRDCMVRVLECNTSDSLSWVITPLKFPVPVQIVGLLFTYTILS